MAKSANSLPFITPTFQNGVEYHNPDFKRFSGNDLAISCKNLVNFSPATPGFTNGKGVGLRPLVDQQFSYICLAVPLLDTALISTEFCGVMGVL